MGYTYNADELNHVHGSYQDVKIAWMLVKKIAEYQKKDCDIQLFHNVYTHYLPNEGETLPNRREGIITIRPEDSITKVIDKLLSLVPQSGRSYYLEVLTISNPERVVGGCLVNMHLYWGS